MEIKSLLRRAARSKFVGNTGWLLFQHVYSMLLSLVIGALSARYLGPSNYGLIGYGASLVSLFTSLSQLGLNSVLMNELLTSPDEMGKTLGTALGMRLAASVVSFCCILVFVNIMEPGNRVLLVITALQAFAIVCHIYELLNEWFLSRLQSKVYVAAALAGTTAVGAWRILLLTRGASVAWFAASGTIQALVCGGIVAVVFAKQKQFCLSFDFARAKELFGKSRHYIISSLAISLYTQMDTVMVGKMMGETQVGLYASAMTIAMLWEFVPQAVIHSSRAVILERKTKDYDGYLRLFQILLLAVTVMGILIGCAFQVLGKYIILLLYGEKYAGAGLLLNILIWSTCFAMVGTARGIWNVAENKNRYVKYYTVIGCMFNLGFNYFAILAWGATGAAIGTLLSQVIVALGAPMLWKETRPFVKLYFHSWKYLKYIGKPRKK